MGFQMRDPSRHHDEVNRSFAYCPVGNMHVPTLRVLNLSGHGIVPDA